eukprot:Amastigsp_a345223_6.p2 type:complete len:106 gc:universal Amastigsp_a345223_6:244-561(+)
MALTVSAAESMKSTSTASSVSKHVKSNSMGCWSKFTRVHASPSPTRSTSSKVKDMITLHESWWQAEAHAADAAGAEQGGRAAAIKLPAGRSTKSNELRSIANRLA